jgi:hypothetical protein
MRGSWVERVIAYGGGLINGGILMTRDDVYEMYVRDRIGRGYSLMFITSTIIVLVSCTVQVGCATTFEQRVDGQHVLADD